MVRLHIHIVIQDTKINIGMKKMGMKDETFSFFLFTNLYFDI